MAGQRSFIEDARDTHADSLRTQLAHVLQREEVESASQRRESEAMLQRAVRMRAQKRELQHEVLSWRNELRSASGTQQELSRTHDVSTQRLRDELESERIRLAKARADLRRANGTGADDDDDDESVVEMRRRNDMLREEESEYDAAREAAVGLASRLEQRFDDLEAEADRERALGKPDYKQISQNELERLKRNVDVLSSQVRMTDAEVGAEARSLWDNLDQELVKLRFADSDRRRLQQMRVQAKYDRDHLEANYERIITGLEEQEVLQSVNTRALREGLAAARTEGHEMTAMVQGNRRRIAEIREDRWKVQTFVQHLQTQVARLEDERNNLRESLEKRPPATLRVPHVSEGGLLELDNDAKKEATEFLRQDRQRVVVDCQHAMARDEAEVAIVERSCKELEESLRKTESENVELRSEAIAMAPLLGNRPRAVNRELADGGSLGDLLRQSVSPSTPRHTSGAQASAATPAMSSSPGAVGGGDASVVSFGDAVSKMLLQGPVTPRKSSAEQASTTSPRRGNSPRAIGGDVAAFGRSGDAFSQALLQGRLVPGESSGAQARTSAPRLGTSPRPRGGGLTAAASSGDAWSQVLLQGPLALGDTSGVQGAKKKK